MVSPPKEKEQVSPAMRFSQPLIIDRTRLEPRKAGWTRNCKRDIERARQRRSEIETKRRRRVHLLNSIDERFRDRDTDGEMQR